MSRILRVGADSIAGAGAQDAAVGYAGVARRGMYESVHCLGVS